MKYIKHVLSFAFFAFSILIAGGCLMPTETDADFENTGEVEQEWDWGIDPIDSNSEVLWNCDGWDLIGQLPHLEFTHPFNDPDGVVGEALGAWYSMGRVGVQPENVDCDVGVQPNTCDWKCSVWDKLIWPFRTYYYSYNNCGDDRFSAEAYFLQWLKDVKHVNLISLDYETLWCYQINP